MKRLSALLCTLVLAISLAPASFADVVLEPEGNSYYDMHREDCSYPNRDYLAAGADDIVTFYQAPDMLIPQKTVDNGEQLYILATVQDGEHQWGFVDGADAWVPMDDLTPVYDTISFAEDFADEIVPFTWEAVPMPVAQLYTYPNSGESYALKESVEDAYITASLSEQYVDENGNEWGYVRYYMQNQGWICLTDPTNIELDSGVMTAPPSVAQTRGTPTITEEDIMQSGMTVVIVVVAIFVMVAACFILMRRSFIKRVNNPIEPIHTL